MKAILFAAVTAIGLTTNFGAQAAMRMATPAEIGVSTPHTQAPTQAGIMSCTLHSDPDRHATCVFRHAAGANSFSETYDTKLTRLLADTTVETGQTMRWAVYTQGGRADPGILLGARPLPAHEGASGTKDVSFSNDGRRITFKQLHGPSVTAEAGKARLEFVPSAKPVELPSRKSLQITVMQ